MNRRKEMNIPSNPELTPEVKHVLLPGEEGVRPWMGLNLGVSL